MALKPRLALLLFFVPLLAPRFAHAQEKRQLFGVQKQAIDPICSSDDDLLAVSDEQTDGFQVWDVASRRPLWKSDDYFMLFAPDTESQRTKYVMVARDAHPEEGNLVDLKGVKLELLDAHTGKFIRQMDRLSAEDEAAEEDAFLDYGLSEDGGQFRVATQSYLRIYNIQNGFLEPPIEWSGINADEGLRCAAFVAEKEQVIAFDGSIVILNATTGALIRRFPLFVPLVTNGGKTNSDGPDHIEVSPDESLFVEQFAEADASRIYRLSDGKLVWSTKDWPTFSPDGKLAYVPSPTGLNVLDARTGRKLKQLKGPKDYGFDTSADGNWLYETRGGQIFRWRTH